MNCHEKARLKTSDEVHWRPETTRMTCVVIHLVYSACCENGGRTPRLPQAWEGPRTGCVRVWADPKEKSGKEGQVLEWTLSRSRDNEMNDRIHMTVFISGWEGYSRARLSNRLRSSTSSEEGDVGPRR